MNRPYTSESWNRFKTHMQNLIKRVAIVETRAKNNEDDINELQPAIEDLQEFVNNNDDMTTGINLIRGSRDFTVGVIPYGTADGLKLDGTNSGPSTYYELFKDELGYSVYRYLGTSPTTTYKFLNVLLPSQVNGYGLTISFEYMIESESVNNGMLFQLMKMDLNGTTQTLKSFYYNDTDFARPFVKGQWYNIVLYYDEPFNLTDGEYLRLGLTSAPSGDLTRVVNYRKVKVELGHINNPIYSVSPLDMSLEPVNDVTTGINLLRGTRDALQGSISSGLSNAAYLDGCAFTASYWEVVHPETQGEFGLYKRLPNGVASHLYFNPIYASDVNGKELTFSAEVMFTERPSSNINLMQIIPFEDGVTVGKDVYATIATTGYTYQTVPLNEWVKIVWIITTPFTLQDNGYVRAALTGNSIDSGIRYYRKPKLEIGMINNPVYSMSPFDVAHGPVNDITTGINLLRGTRDVVKGSQQVGGSFALDGFIMDSQFTTEICDDGFGCFTIDLDQAYSANRYARCSLVNRKGRTVVTVSGQVKLLSATEGSRSFMRTGKFDSAGTLLSPKAISFNSLSIDPNKVGEWQKFSYIWDTTLDVSDDMEYITVDFFYPMNTTNGGYSVKQMCMVDGAIEHLEWSESPFDLASSRIETSYPLLMGDVISENIINANDDMNDYKTPGVYGCNSNNITTIKNPPFASGAFKLYVEYSNNGTGNYIRQKAVKSDKTAQTAERLCVSNSWNAWQYVVDNVQLSNLPYISGIYAGENLANKFKAEIGSNNIAYWLSSRVSQGNFDGLLIGDWVNISCTGATRKYIIAAIDPYYNVGSSGSTRIGHHLVMVPSERWALSSSRDGAYAVGSSNYYIKWNTEKNNNGVASEGSPYLASNLHKWEKEVAITQFPQEWQDVMIDFYTKVETRYSASSALSNANGVKWANLGQLWSPSEIELFGHSSKSGREASCIGTHFPLFYNLKEALKGASVWTRDVADDSSINAVYSDYLGGSNATNIDAQSMCPFPCFLIG